MAFNPVIILTEGDDNSLGGWNDTVHVEVDGHRILSETYELKRSVLQQPAGFSARFGSDNSMTVGNWTDLIRPRISKYRISIGAVPQQSGLIFDVSSNDASSTVVDVEGRDYLSVLFDAYVREEKTFHEKTFYDLTRAVMDIVGLTEDLGFRLEASNETNRLKLSGAGPKGGGAQGTPGAAKTQGTQSIRDQKAAAIEQNRARLGRGANVVPTGLARFGIAPGRPSAAETIANPQPQKVVVGKPLTVKPVQDTERAGYVAPALSPSESPTALVDQRTILGVQTGAGAGSLRTVVQTLRAKLGRRFDEFLQEQYRKAGLFLWNGADGAFILARPSANKRPIYRLYRAIDARRGRIDKYTNVLDHSFQNKTTGRHTSVIVYGKGAERGTNGKLTKRIRAEVFDYELYENTHFDAPLVVHDNDVETTEEAEYTARRMLAEERRQGWSLQYTVPGHLARENSTADGAVRVWSNDEVVEVDDKRLGIRGRFYIEAVTYRKNPHAMTVLTLMRPEDLVFAENLYPGAT